MLGSGILDKTKVQYGNKSIKKLEGPDHVRLRPGVIFGSTGLEGCMRSVFSMLFIAIIEALEGSEKKVVITYRDDQSIEVQDFGCGYSVDYDPKTNCYGWEMLFTELCSFGHKGINDIFFDEFYLLNGICFTQYAAEWMDVEVKRDGFKYNLRFENGFNKGGLTKKVYTGRETGTKIRWKPDIEVFNDINIPRDYFIDTLKRLAIVNSGLLIEYREQQGDGYITQNIIYEHGIADYICEKAGDERLTAVQFWSDERCGRDCVGMPEYKLKINIALCFLNQNAFREYYHNFRQIEPGTAYETAIKNVFLHQIHNYIKQNNKYKNGESEIIFSDIEKSLALVGSSFSRSSIICYDYTNVHDICNMFIKKSIEDILNDRLIAYFTENKDEAEKIADIVLNNKRNRERKMNND